MSLRRRVAVAFIAFAGLGAVRAGSTPNYAVIDAAYGLLPKNVVPIAYVIDVAPDPKTMKIAGHETIAIVMRHNAKTIVLNALQMSFKKVLLDGKTVNITTNAAKGQATIASPQAIAAGKHMLDIAYTATLQNTGQGLFKQPYRDRNGKPAFMYATQLETTDARRLFPGWDEPVYRSTFQMSFVVPKDWTAVSNTPVVSTVPAGQDLKRVSFAPTPPMPSYLVVLCAGDFEKISDEADGVKLSVYATRGKIGEAKYALTVMKELMPYYDAYYGVHFPISKLDAIAVPGVSIGGMENWGGITYGESTILFDPTIHAESYKRDVFDIIAHEESHQWNGDLTSFAWWDDVWLAEGFATWMERKAPDHFHPEWNVYLRAAGDVDYAMGRDAQITAHAIYTPIPNETQAAAIFDSESYTKAGTVFRMLEQYVGPANFQAALQHYYRTHSYTSFNATDLWADIGAQSHTDVAALVRSWIREPGFPLVTATATCAGEKRTVALTQRRYLSDASLPAGSTVWSVPLNVQTDATSQTTTAVLFDEPSMTIDGGQCDRPLMINGNDVGFYRTQYDDATRAQQQASFLKLEPADRLSLLSDAQSFVNSGYAKIDDYLGYAKADAGDTDPLVVGGVISEYGTFLSFEKAKPGEAAAKRFVLSQVKPMLAAFGGWDGTGMNDDQLALRNRILALLADCGDAETLAEAKVRFEKLVAHPAAFTPLNKMAILSVAGYTADMTIYKQLLAMALAERDPQQQSNELLSLFIANDPALAQKNLQLSLRLPPEFAPYAPYMVAYVGYDHPQIAWKFLNDNFDKLFATQTSFSRADAITGVGQRFATRIPADEIAVFFKAHVPADGAPQVKRAMDVIATQQAMQERLLPQIDAYVVTQAVPAK
jgi:aminopeptidase N